MSGPAGLRAAWHRWRNARAVLDVEGYSFARGEDMWAAADDFQAAIARAEGIEAAARDYVRAWDEATTFGEVQARWRKLLAAVQDTPPEGPGSPRTGGNDEHGE